MSENEKQQECWYCHGDSQQIMYMEDNEADVRVAGKTLRVSVFNMSGDYIMSGAYINYCPMCGRKL